MKTKKVDVAIIGGGTAGLNARRAALTHTDSVVLIEEGFWGTTCARVGCMPTKLLIAAAENTHHIEKSPSFGIHLRSKPEIIGKEVMSRVLSERDRFVGFVVDSVNSIPSEQKIEGNAQFIDNTTLEVNALRIEAKRIVIATGSRPAFPQKWKEFGENVITSDELFYMEDLPSSVAVFGTGVIGLEIAQALHRLGVNIRLFGNSGRIRPITDPKLRDYTEKTLNEEFYIIPKNPVQSIYKSGKYIEIEYCNRKGEKEVFTTEYILAATGRIPNIDTLGVENTDIQCNDKGIPFIKDRYTMQTTVPTIFIAGDASNETPLLHEAADQGKIAGGNAGAYPKITKGLRRSHLAVVFSDPQIAIVGENFRTLVDRLGEENFAIGEVSFEGQGRARIMLRNKGLLRVYGDKKNGRFLGAEMLAPNAEHLGHLLAWTHQMEMTVEEMLQLPFYHPVIEEGIRTALEDLQKKLTSNELE